MTTDCSIAYLKQPNNTLRSDARECLALQSSRGAPVSVDVGSLRHA
jgi:hypothetical protein